MVAGPSLDADSGTHSFAAERAACGEGSGEPTISPMILTMDRERLWEIVERARAGAGAGAGETVTAEAAEAVARQLVSQLTALGPAAAVEFQLAYDALNQEAYRWNLWAAAYLLRGGCSDDGFDYFCGWLVAQGRSVWEQAVADPDSLADAGVDPDDDMVECEDVLAAALNAYAEATGDEEAFWEALDAARHDRPEADFTGPAGDDFDFDDDEQMRAHLPRLAAIYRPTKRVQPPRHSGQTPQPS